MSRYNEFKYAEALYGSTTITPTRNLTWSLIVDWDADGYYTGENEAHDRMVDLTVSRGRDHLIKANGSGFEPFGIGEFTCILDNEDGRYDPWNTSSPLYPYVSPGKFCRLAVKDEVGGPNYSVMRGIVNDIQPLLRNGKQHVRAVVRDGLSWLEGKTVVNGLAQGVTFSSQLGVIINDAGMGSGTRVNTEWGWTVDGGASVYTTTRPYWWAWEQPAREAIQQIMDACLCNVFHSRTGNIKIKSREFTYDQTLTATEDLILRDMVLPQPWEMVRNDVRFRVYPLVLNPLNTTLWNWEEVPYHINPSVPGTTVEVYDALFRYQHWTPCGSGVQFDVSVNELADGSGTDMSAEYVASSDPDIGEGVQTIRVANVGGGYTDVYITELIAVGDIIYSPYQRMVSSQDTTSQDTYGAKTLAFDSRWQGNTTEAQSLCDQVLAVFKDPKPLPMIQFEGRPAQQFGYDLMARVDLDLATPGISGYYRIGKIEHKWLRENGQAVRTTYKLEPYFALS